MNLRQEKTTESFFNGRQNVSQGIEPFRCAKIDAILLNSKFKNVYQFSLIGK